MDNDKQKLNAELQMKENFINNIPGGVHQCRNDSEYTLLSMSNAFLSMFGYTREEIRHLFHGRYREMIYPGDRDEVAKSINEQLKKGNDIEIEYRVVKKDGTPIWILDRGRLTEDDFGGFFCCILIEITDRKREQEELRLSLERHKVIMDQTIEIIFEWDICQDTLRFSSNWYRKFGYEGIRTNVSKRIPLSDKIYQEDMPVFMKIINDTAKGIPYSETELRIKDIKGKAYWCRIRATAQYDSEGNPIKAIGVIIDIDNEKKQNQLLFEQTQRDDLTGLYNKMAINSLVRRRINDSGNSALQAILILDVDYFKEVNDTYGHLAGDSILSKVAAALKNSIGSKDLIGRIGGDEFLIYFAGEAERDSVLGKAERMLKSLMMITPEAGAPSITCSIGLIVFQNGESNYEELYKKADLALYYRKRNGRNGITLYDPKVCKEDIMKNSQDSAAGSDIGSDEERVSDGRMAQYVFRTLYHARDIEASVRQLLEIIGRSYDVSRVYIFENSEDGIHCCNTFEWCNKGIEPQKDKLQNLSYHNLGDYNRYFNDKGVFYCANTKDLPAGLYKIMEFQGIRSVLWCAMLDEGEYTGFMGFDECRENRAWNAKQVAAIKLTADVFSVFLARHRQKKREEAECRR